MKFRSSIKYFKNSNIRLNIQELNDWLKFVEPEEIAQIRIAKDYEGTWITQVHMETKDEVRQL